METLDRWAAIAENGVEGPDPEDRVAIIKQVQKVLDADDFIRWKAEDLYVDELNALAVQTLQQSMESHYRNDWEFIDYLTPVDGENFTTVSFLHADGKEVYLQYDMEDPDRHIFTYRFQVLAARLS